MISQSQGSANPARVQTVLQPCNANIFITREITHFDLAQVMELRNECFFENPKDPRYSKGGVHTLLDLDTIFQKHAEDRESRFVFVQEPDNPQLLGYSRFTIVQPGSDKHEKVLQLNCDHLGKGPLLWNVIVIVKESERGKLMQIGTEKIRASDAMLSALDQFGRQAGCSGIFSEIATSPVGNIASVNLHTRHGFERIGNADSLHRDGVEVVLSTYAKAL